MPGRLGEQEAPTVLQGGKDLSEEPARIRCLVDDGKCQGEIDLLRQVVDPQR
jgi:hypothetical protein